ncbi:MAG TPA: ATP12 family protein [Acidocella sp.]|jgi:chaperone required for assembly of F1-ATPase|uniref:ATP12 family chaperone protein n=1 Tax=Acidocella sp. TaxID=50710 RepID=UPI002C8EDD31|nr:ATP12 family protein [Acidocella sp.]HVE22984.1 ATP12 family protein [Acidocella sp.]
MKRFWSTASVEREGDAFTVRLDARKLKLPGGAALSVPFAPLAEAIAAEWATAPENFTPDDVPLTRLVATAQERVRTHRAAIIDQLTAYGRNDLLCYRATDGAARATEDEAWSPWTGWAEQRFGITLAIAAGLMPVAQSPAAHAAFKKALEDMSDYALAGLGVIVPALGSLILGLAIAAGALPPAEACRLAALEELTQERSWGTDAETETRRHKRAEDVAESARFMVLCQT